MNPVQNIFKWIFVYYKCYRIDVSEAIDVNETSESKECNINIIVISQTMVLNSNQMSAIDAMIY